MHQPAAHNLSAEVLADGLMTQTNSEQRLARIGAGGDQIEADPGLIGRAWTGRDQEALRAARQRLTC